MKEFFSKIYRDKKLLFISIFIVSVLFSILFLLILGDFGPSEHEQPGSDFFARYKPVAESLMQGQGLTKEGEVLTSSPPGYPIILSGIFLVSDWTGINEIQLIVFFNVIFVALASCLLFLIGEALFSRKMGLIASVLWLSYPFNLWFIKNPHTEVPFILLLYLGIFLYILSIKKMNFFYIIMGGFAIGASSLIRPNSMLLVLVLAILVFLFKRLSFKKRLLFAFLLIMANLSILFPWELYVFQDTGEIIPLSTMGSTILVRGLTFTVQEGEGGDRTPISSELQEFMEKVRTQDFENKQEMISFAFGEFRKNPSIFFELLWLRITRSWYATSQQWYEGIILAVQIPYLAAALYGLVYAFRKRKEKILSMVLILAVILYFYALTLSTHTILRYMVPVMGLVLIFSAFPISILVDKIYGKVCLSNNSLQE